MVPVLSKNRKKPGRATDLGRWFRAFVCSLALALTIVGPVGSAATAANPNTLPNHSSTLQSVAMLDHGQADAVELGGHLISHCGQSSVCGEMILGKFQDVDGFAAEVRVASDANGPVAGRAVAPPFHPPRT